jgi:methylthioribulose-1-phosphate dehydratase
VSEHNGTNGHGEKGGRYTRGRLPVSLSYTEAQPNRSFALKREAAIKRLSKADKEMLVLYGSLEDMKKQSVTSKDEKETRQLVCEFLRLFYNKGWVTGTGGGISASFAKDQFLIAPTGVHKERVLPADLFVVNSQDGMILRSPKNKSLRLSECAPIFCQIIQKRGAGAVLHSHALSTVLAADCSDTKDSLLIEGLEMLKGIANENNKSRHIVPIVSNTMYERELCATIEGALYGPDFSKSYCILVRDHGAYIWGKDIWETKRHAEVYHFLFEAVVARKQMRQNGHAPSF